MSTSSVFSNLPHSTSETQAASEATSDKATTNGNLEEARDVILENPFSNENSRILFDAIDQIQSCGAGQDIQIPQLVIIGEQSTGKSSLLQSLTDIPFPVGAGCCTRFATRIVSKRTAPHTTNSYKITIVEPEVTIHDFDYPPSDTYKDYVRVGESLTADDFVTIMDEVSTSYMGIKAGKGDDKKNFATEVLRIELSGPLRSHFSIVDIPGIFRNDHGVNPNEMRGIRELVLEYMRKEGNIVICVADAVTDFSNQEIPSLAVKTVDKKRLVGVFTKCDLAASPDKVVSIATSVEDNGQSMHDGWFVVRNRSDKEEKSFDISQAESQLFARTPWNVIRSDRRGSSMLRKYLSNLLCARIRDNFPAIQASIKDRLFMALASRDALGTPRPTHHERLQYLRDVVGRFENIVGTAMEKPGLLPEELRLRSLITDENKKFSKLMQDDGHTHEFQYHNMEPAEALARVLEERTASISDPFGFLSVSSNGLDGKLEAGNTSPVTPPASVVLPFSRSANTTSQQQRKSPRKELRAAQGAAEADTALFKYIRQELRTFQSTQLPGLVNPEVMPVVFRAQTEKWPIYAREHLGAVAEHVAQGAVGLLKYVFPPASEPNKLHEKLVKVLETFWVETKNRTLVELNTFCYRERFSLLATTDPRFFSGFRALQTIRLLQSMDSLKSNYQSPHAAAVYEQLHFSTEDNLVPFVHDILKVYYQVSVESFIRHITHNIIEDFVSNPNGPLKSLSRKWVDSLSEAEVENLAREDEDIAAKRERCTAVIDRLEKAHEIATKASDRTMHISS